MVEIVHHGVVLPDTLLGALHRRAQRDGQSVVGRGEPCQWLGVPEHEPGTSLLGVEEGAGYLGIEVNRQSPVHVGRDP